MYKNATTYLSDIAFLKKKYIDFVHTLLVFNYMKWAEA